MSFQWFQIYCLKQSIRLLTKAPPLSLAKSVNKCEENKTRVTRIPAASLQCGVLFNALFSTIYTRSLLLIQEAPEFCKTQSVFPRINSPNVC